MKLSRTIHLLSRRFHVPTAILVALLQRTPVARVVSMIDNIAPASPLGALLKSSAAVVASLGALNSLAGASVAIVTNPVNEYVGTAGAPIYDPNGNATLTFFVTPINIWADSWMIAGDWPPGLSWSCPASLGTRYGPGQQNESNSDNEPGGVLPPGEMYILGTPSTAGVYPITVTGYESYNGTGTSVSAVYTLVIGPPAGTPGMVVIKTQPASQSATVGSNVTMSVVATGATSYQWQIVDPTVTVANGVILSDGGNVSGSATSTLTLTNVTASQAGSYSVIVSNSVGPIISSTAVLTVTAPTTVAPVFTANPQSQTVVSGTTVVFNSTASGTPTPTYQWKLNGAAVSGATSARLVVSGATSANAGSYTCVATNSVSSVTSNAATLTIDSAAGDIANPGRLVNLSVNTIDGSGAQAMTVGFNSGGVGTSGSQTLLIRASGPALTAYGVSGVLPDPVLTLYNTAGAVVISNSGWASTPGNEAAVLAADSATGAFSLTNPASLDSAVVETLVESGYTVQVSGKSGDSGRTIAEVYDNTPSGTYTLATPRLVNLSCRIQVSAGSSLTTGFTIGGATSKSVLVRASGPALSNFGVSGVMPDPQLQLFTGSTQIASNAGWGGDPQLTAAMNAVYAFLYTNSSSADSALLVTLPPGTYTAVASSVSGTAGITLVEVYEVP